MLVSHVSLQVELFELCEPAEAEQADDLPAQIVAEIPLSPDPLERTTVVDSIGHHLKRMIIKTLQFINIAIEEHQSGKTGIKNIKNLRQ